MPTSASRRNLRCAHGCRSDIRVIKVLRVPAAVTVATRHISSCWTMCCIAPAALLQSFTHSCMCAVVSAVWLLAVGGAEECSRA